MKNTLLEALKSAGEIQMKHYRSVKHISVKENFTSIVTEADIESEKKIISVIESHHPGHNILSEEAGFIDKKSQHTWVIDPIDGTSNYAAGLPWFGALIALVKDKTPVLAGAYMPVQDNLYLAEAGNGATLNGETLKIESRELQDALAGFSTNYTLDEAYHRKALGLYSFLVGNTRNVRTTNALIDLLSVAEGRYGGCVIMFNGIWDVAAPWLIIKEAGGITTDLEGRDIDFTIDENTVNKNYPVVMGSELFVKKVLDVVATLL